MSLRTSILLGALLAAVPPASGPRAGAPPILAAEDSLRVYTLPETTRVRSTRVPLRELIRKAQEGERHKFDGIHTMAFNRTVKVTLEFGGRKPHTECRETTSRVYYRAPDRWREVVLQDAGYKIAADGTREPLEEDDDGPVHIQLGDDFDDVRRLDEVPEYLERVDQYDFEIVDRHLKPGQVLYEIAFRPRSDFELLPSGRIWLLTGGYQIVREEFEFEHLPMPGILKDVSLVTREWQEIEGHWVEKRITARADIGIVPMLGAPKRIEVALVFDGYRFDPPLEDALFERGGR